MPSVLRIIDANANRAREAIRVMEEAARFVLNDAGLAGELKQLRHDLCQRIDALPGLDASRDTPGDVGTTLSTSSEATRASAYDVAAAAGKRLSEALRSIEEYGKTLGDDVGPAGFAKTIEAIRYRGYDIEQRLNRAMGIGAPRQWRLCVLLTESLCTHRSWQDVLQQVIDAGADCVQLREKDQDAGWLMRKTEDAVKIAAGRAAIIVNDRPDVALAAGADGVHVGQTDLPLRAVRRLVGRQLIVGVSTSHLAQAQRAAEQGADYCGVGPMFATTTKHKTPEQIVGPAYLRQYLQAFAEGPRLPHLAIGGITPENLGELVEAGAQGVAVSSAVCGAAEPGEVVRRMLELLPGPDAGATGSAASGISHRRA